MEKVRGSASFSFPRLVSRMSPMRCCVAGAGGAVSWSAPADANAVLLEVVGPLFQAKDLLQVGVRRSRLVSDAQALSGVPSPFLFSFGTLRSRFLRTEHFRAVENQAALAQTHARKVDAHSGFIFFSLSCW